MQTLNRYLEEIGTCGAECGFGAAVKTVLFGAKLAGALVYLCFFYIQRKCVY